jgi:hemerythrin superfamily protein
MPLQDHTRHQEEMNMAEQARKALDAIDLLMQDHREVESLFSEFEYLQRKGEDTAQVIENACAELRNHDALENDVFYPAVSDAAVEEEMQELLDEADDSHDRVLDEIEALEQENASDTVKRNAHFAVIIDEVKQHILAEEADIFPRVKKLQQLDFDALTADMKTRKSELMAETEVAQVTAENV